MRNTTQRLALALALALVLIGALTASGMASTSQQALLEDPSRLLSTNPAVQNASLDEIKLLGADIVKIPVPWRSIAPDPVATTKPAGDMTDPNTYGAQWTTTDTVVNGAIARGLKVWILITAPAPRWAVSKETSPGLGAYNPSAPDLGDFAQAVGRRYAGVTTFSIWNEPNLSRYIQPTYKAGVAVSAVQYRKMYQAAYTGLVASGHASSTILFGELLPRAKPPRSSRATIPPLMWLRDFFCIDVDGKKLTGPAAKKRSCAGYKPIKASGFAYHPYTQPVGPLQKEAKAGKDNATIYYLKRIERVLDQASKTKRLAKRRLKIYSSEFGFQSDPPDINFTPIKKIPGFMNISEWLSYKDPRVATYSQYELVDDSDLSGFQSGLRFDTGEIKTDIYQAYQLPLNVFKQTSSSVLVWGDLRSSPGATQTVDIQVKQGSDFVSVGTATVTSANGYFQKKVSVPSANGKTFRIAWNGLTSRSTKAVALVKGQTD